MVHRCIWQETKKGLGAAGKLGHHRFSPTSRAVLSKRTFCNDGSVFYLWHPLWEPLESLMAIEPLNSGYSADELKCSFYLMLINIKLNGQRGIIALCSQRVKTYWSSQILMKKVKVLIAQLCLTLYNSLDYSPPDSSVHEFFQARILEQVAFPSPKIFLPQGLNRVSCIFCIGRQILYY